MITSISIYNERSNFIELSLSDSSAPYFVKNIDGLGPVNATISTTTYAAKDGGAFQNARANMRNLVMQIGLNPSYVDSADPYGELRRAIYPILNPKNKVTIVIFSDNMETLFIDGWVETFEPTIFSKDPDFTVSIICPDAYFKSVEPVIGTRIGSGDIQIQNNGNVETGLTILIDGFYSDINDFTITKTATDVEVMTYVGDLNIDNNFLSFYFITDKGYKTALVKEQTDPLWVPGTTDPMAPFAGTNILGFVDGWLTIEPGESLLEFDLDENSYPLPIITAFLYSKYSGI